MSEQLANVLPQPQNSSSSNSSASSFSNGKYLHEVPGTGSPFDLSCIALKPEIVGQKPSACSLSSSSSSSVKQQGKNKSRKLSAFPLERSNSYSREQDFSESASSSMSINSQQRVTIKSQQQNQSQKQPQFQNLQQAKLKSRTQQKSEQRRFTSIQFHELKQKMFDTNMLDCFVSPQESSFKQSNLTKQQSLHSSSKNNSNNISSNDSHDMNNNNGKGTIEKKKIPSTVNLAQPNVISPQIPLEKRQIEPIGHRRCQSTSIQFGQKQQEESLEYKPEAIQCCFSPFSMETNPNKILQLQVDLKGNLDFGDDEEEDVEDFGGEEEKEDQGSEDNSMGIFSPSSRSFSSNPFFSQSPNQYPVRSNEQDEVHQSYRRKLFNIDSESNLEESEDVSSTNFQPFQQGTSHIQDLILQQKLTQIKDSFLLSQQMQMGNTSQNPKKQFNISDLTPREVINTLSTNPSSKKSVCVKSPKEESFFLNSNASSMTKIKSNQYVNSQIDENDSQNPSMGFFGSDSAINSSVFMGQNLLQSNYSQFSGQFSQPKQHQQQQQQQSEPHYFASQRLKTQPNPQTTSVQLLNSNEVLHSPVFQQSQSQQHRKSLHLHTTELQGFYADPAQLVHTTSTQPSSGTATENSPVKQSGHIDNFSQLSGRKQFTQQSNQKNFMYSSVEQTSQQHLSNSKTKYSNKKSLQQPPPNHKRQQSNNSQYHNESQNYVYYAKPQAQNSIEQFSEFDPTKYLPQQQLIQQQQLQQQQGRNRQTVSQQSTEYRIDLKKIQQDGRTTLMIKNIPNKYEQDILLQTINRRHGETYDFFYLPIDFSNNCNVGYAFINFKESRFIEAFYKEFNDQKWKKYNSDKICQLCYARIQGSESLNAHFRSSSVMNQKDNKYKPLFIDLSKKSAIQQIVDQQKKEFQKEQR